VKRFGPAPVTAEGPVDRDRGQLVLVAAAALAIVLFPLVLAYLQLGYAGDVAAEPTGSDPAAELDRALDRAIHDAAADVDAGTTTGAMGDESTSAKASIEDPDAAATAFKRALESDVKRIETARIEDGTAARIEYAPGVADAWVADGRWHDGVDANFPEPTSHGGVVVQERAGEPTIVAVAVDVHLRTPDATIDRQMVVHVHG